MSWVRKNTFTLVLMAAVILGFLVPEGGMRGGWLRSEVTTRWGIALLFMLQGLGLPTRALAAGLFNWRLHAFVQSWNFLWAPALVGLLILLAGSWLPPEAWAGFWYLAILPTTVSSAVALTILARGDVVGAVFNTTLANVLAVVIVPLWTVALFSVADGVGGVHLGALLWDLVKLILLPLLVGQALRPFVRESPVFKQWQPRFKSVGNAIIVFIVYATFSNSVIDRTWSGFGAELLLKLVVLVAVFVVLMAWLVWLSARWIDRGGLPVRIAAFYCASQKSLATGIPMANAIFGAAAAAGAIDLGLLILPLLISHPMQLLLGGFLAESLARRVAAEEGAPV